MRSFLVSWFQSFLFFGFLTFGFLIRSFGVSKIQKCHVMFYWNISLPYYRHSISCFLEDICTRDFHETLRPIFMICRCPPFQQLKHDFRIVEICKSNMLSQMSGAFLGCFKVSWCLQRLGVMDTLENPEIMKMRGVMDFQ